MRSDLWLPILLATALLDACAPGRPVTGVPALAAVAAPADVAAPAATAAPADVAAPAATAAPAAEPGVPPDINEKFLDPGLDVEQWAARFEGESREIFVHRDAITAAVHLEPGDAVADIGAGTGLFLEPFARAVGPGGTVYALDISPVFVEHLRSRARRSSLAQVRPQVCSEDSIDLPEAFIDRAFLCDTYHHLEYPQRTMASVHRALRPGGEVVVVDFKRIPGLSSAWILDHVRAGTDEVIAEIESFGFSLVEEVAVPGLEENYVLRFRRR